MQKNWPKDGVNGIIPTCQVYQDKELVQNGKWLSRKWSLKISKENRKPYCEMKNGWGQEHVAVLWTCDADQIWKCLN